MPSLTRRIVETLERLQRAVPILFTSSSQAECDNPYGRSKKAAEEILTEYSKRTGAPIFIYRLPGVFGKWSRPDYNTVVATFCHNIARGLEIKVSDPAHVIELVYIDDVIRHFIDHLHELPLSGGSRALFPDKHNIQGHPRRSRRKDLQLAGYANDPQGS